MDGNRLRRPAALVWVVGAAVAGWPASAAGTALDDYVAAPDAHYAFSLDHQYDGPDYTAYILSMTSQQWRSAAEVDRPVWQHWLTLIVPDAPTGTTGLLWINGGRNGDAPPTFPDIFLTAVARESNTVVADLRMVPNEPLKFTDETDSRYIADGRVEDQIIAYTFDKYMTTGDDTWPLLLPMVKSAVRAMDTVQTYLATAPEGSVTVDRFVVSGGSKRGWTTWLTAAVDPRVIAIAPAVIDVLNLDRQMEHHFSAYGFYAEAVQDYVDMNVFARLATPQGQALVRIVDPYEYRDRYAAMPKFLINSSGDDFFVPDSAQFYFHDLPGERLLRYVPNTDHSLGGSDAVFSLRVFYGSILAGSARPAFTWTIPEAGSIRVETDPLAPPTQVRLWQGTNPAARDFRKNNTSVVYTSTSLADRGGGVYLAQVPTPPQGWTAFFIELEYPSPLGIAFKVTTQIAVTPDILPFPQTPDCNDNRFSDALDIADGTSADRDGNGIPDACEAAVPALSAWGFRATLVLMLAVGGAVIRRRRGANA